MLVFIPMQLCSCSYRHAHADVDAHAHAHAVIPLHSRHNICIALGQHGDIADDEVDAIVQALGYKMSNAGAGCRFSGTWCMVFAEFFAYEYEI